MNTLFPLSAVLAVIYSAFNIDAPREIWVFPVFFAVIWLLLWLLSLGISMSKDYDRRSPFYYRVLNSGYRFLCAGGETVESEIWKAKVD